MAKIPKFCPECGTEMGGKPVCEKCGFDTNINEEKNMSSNKSGGSKSTWETLEPYVSIVGKWAWVYGIVVGIVYIIIAFAVTFRAAQAVIFVWEECEALYPGLCGPRPTGVGYGAMVWQLINAAVLIVASLLWIKPKFCDPCGQKDWEKLLTDVVKIGNIQIPWMLIMGVILEIFGYGWGGLAVLICALLIIFLGPRKYEWKV